MSEYESELKIYIESMKRNHEHIGLEIGLLEKQIEVRKRQLELNRASLEAEGKTIDLAEIRLAQEKSE